MEEYKKLRKNCGLFQRLIQGESSEEEEIGEEEEEEAEEQ